MTTLLGALCLGLILGLLAFGVYISFRLFDVADITVDGSFTLGAAVAAVLLFGGPGTPAAALVEKLAGDSAAVTSALAFLQHPLAATGCAMLAGALAGLVTGLLQARAGINPLLAGIIVMTALYSINLRVMGKSNFSIADDAGLGAWGTALSRRWWGGDTLLVLGWSVHGRDVVLCLGALGLIAATGGALYLFFRTNLGTAMRASGDNPQMVRALGVSVEWCRVLGLALSNALVALGGALFAQYIGFADAQMGIGMIVSGLASVIIGEALTGSRSLGLALTGAIIGSVFFRLLIALAMSFGLEVTDLKLATAVCLFLALVAPAVVARLRRAAPRAAAAGAPRP